MMGLSAATFSATPPATIDLLAPCRDLWQRGAALRRAFSGPPA
jgi:hypothetical protein